MIYFNYRINTLRNHGEKFFFNSRKIENELRICSTFLFSEREEEYLGKDREIKLEIMLQ